MLKKVFLFNGPKFSGKDTVGEYLAKKHNNSKVFMFKEALYHWAARISTLSLAEIMYMSSDRNLKELPHASLPLNRKTGTYFSPREWLIHVSENVIKPLTNKDFFGVSCAESILSSGVDVAFITDSGFEEELKALVNRVAVPDIWESVEFTVVRIHRPGCTFEGDSRNYLGNTLPNVRYLDVHNDKDLETFFAKMEFLLC